jgi:hypothetical protein
VCLCSDEKGWFNMHAKSEHLEQDFGTFFRFCDIPLLSAPNWHAKCSDSRYSKLADSMPPPLPAMRSKDLCETYWQIKPKDWPAIGWLWGHIIPQPHNYTFLCSWLGHCLWTTYVAGTGWWVKVEDTFAKPKSWPHHSWLFCYVDILQNIYDMGT